MKLTGRHAEAFLKAPDPAIRVALIFGPDAGQVAEQGTRLVAAVAGAADDPFRVAELPPAEIRKEPARLADEMAALSLTGGRRVVRLRGADDGLAPAVAACLAERVGDALLVVEAGDLAARSALRKACESAANAAALPCYTAEGADILRLARDMLAQAGKSLDRDAENDLALLLETDRQVVRREIEKLITYVGDRPRIAAADIAAVVGDSAAQSLEDLVLSAADGDRAAVERGLDKVLAEDATPIAVLRAAQRHFARLHAAALHMQAGSDVEAAMARLKPPVFFKAQPSVKAQLRAWRSDVIERALTLLLEAEIACKRTGAPAETLCARALGDIAGMVRRSPPP